MARLYELQTEERTGRNRLINIDNLHKASMEQLGKSQHRYMNYKSKIKSIILGYMNGLGANNLHSMAVLLDLSNERNINRSFTRHQEIVREAICSQTIEEMDHALAMEC